ncbi:hypothetical protein SAY87_017574 [Trapa incisa]|uniref:B box-type domain-containing protein n=1 Tax=Trapa incisa TaxID=236973 RepID=A0AAN7L108_9MYRT|nr:hypothetical protein SAY87_017574 [Trapa incisa]
MRSCALCDAPARAFCGSDQAALCWDCDAKVHSANFLVARHSRTLLCHACQRPTPWTASGAKLGHTVSVCDDCVPRVQPDAGAGEEGSGGNDDDDAAGDDDAMEDEDDGEGGGGGGSEGGSDGGGGDGDNQVVPWSPATPPPYASSSSSVEPATRPWSPIGGKRKPENLNLNGSSSPRNLRAIRMPPPEAREVTPANPLRTRRVQPGLGQFCWDQKINKF